MRDGVRRRETHMVDCPSATFPPHERNPQLSESMKIYLLPWVLDERGER